MKRKCFIISTVYELFFFHSILEIPLFHVLNARITFGNIFAMDAAVPFVTKIQEEERLTCVLDENIFNCPSGYTQIGNGKYCIYLYKSAPVRQVITGYVLGIIFVVTRIEEKFRCKTIIVI